MSRPLSVVGFVVVVGVVSLVLSLLLALLLVGSKGRSRRAHGVHARRLAYMCILAMTAVAIQVGEYTASTCVSVCTDRVSQDLCELCERGESEGRRCRQHGRQHW